MAYVDIVCRLREPTFLQHVKRESALESIPLSMLLLVSSEGVEHFHIFVLAELIQLSLTKNVVLGLICEEKSHLNSILGVGRSLSDGVHWGDSGTTSHEANLVLLVLENLFLELKFAIPEVSYHSDWTLTNDTVANVNILLEMLSELSSIWEIRVLTVNFDDKLSRTFFVNRRNWSVLS